ncbi:hypothetical protein NQ318_013770 [Aromia moschata]|uniref:Uncharacterized protein n=1 Tax=Aromia moschata TaxID=1265417 RepID=A0AAV8ZA61_9CUCU|nr:hypothetical protein NQ318_013770 [Aromia moschata]
MCPKRNKLFCFICLVMGGNQSAWTQEGNGRRWAPSVLLAAQIRLTISLVVTVEKEGLSAYKGRHYSEIKKAKTKMIMTTAKSRKAFHAIDNQRLLEADKAAFQATKQARTTARNKKRQKDEADMEKDLEYGPGEFQTAHIQTPFSGNSLPTGLLGACV